MRPALFCLVLAAVMAEAQVTFQAGPGKIEVAIDGKPFSNLYYGPEWLQPFLHPVRAASGVAVTRGYPVEKIEGESRDHAAHHGLWYAHGDINGVDFWRDKGPEASGRIVPKSPPRTRRDTLRGEFNLVTPEKKTIGSVEEVFRFAARGPNRVVDVRVSVRADQGVALKMGDTEEGSLGLRLRDEFREDRGAVLSNSDALVGTKNIWGKRAQWVDYSAVVGGEKLGGHNLGPSRQPQVPDVLARPRLRAVRGESVRGDQLPQGQDAGRFTDGAGGRQSGFPLPGGDSSRRRRAGRGGTVGGEFRQGEMR